MKKLTDYPIELTKNRNVLEGNFIFTLWKDTDLYGDYGKDIVVGRDILTADGVFYYQLGYELYKAGYNSFDEVTIYTHLQGNDVLTSGFESRGGYSTVQQFKDILDVVNIETYFDNLIKNNTLLQLHDKGFDVQTDLHKFNKMNTSQLYDYFEYQLDNVFLKRGGGVHIEDFDIDEQFIEDCHAGLEKGLSYGKAASLLNYLTMGIHRSNVQIFGGFSGTGKSSFAVAVYLMSILEQGEKITIVANEMNIKAWKHIYLATLLSKEFKYYGLPRKSQKSGNFTTEQLEMIHKAQQFHRENYIDQIKFVKIYDYSVEEVKRVARKQAKLGYNYLLYDTFKAEDAASSNVTGELIEASKQLLQVAEKENISITITMQLAIYMENVRYLTSQTLSNSKGVKEVVSEVILMRKLWEDEYTGCKFDIKAWNFKKDHNGKLTKIKEYIELDPEKKYRILFLDKTRNDEDGVCVLFRFDGAWNKWTELGYCTPQHMNRM